VLLAAGAAGAGFVGVPHLLKPAVAHAGGEHHVGLWMPATTVVLALLAMVSAGYLYLLYTEIPGWAARRFPRLVRALEAKWGFDNAFNWLARRVVVEGSSGLLWRRVDVGVIDGAVNGTARAVAAVARRVRTAQTGLVRGYALVMFGGAVLLLAYLVWR
jgi:NADH-quinone oxidoreductase subunit L